MSLIIQLKTFSKIGSEYLFFWPGWLCSEKTKHQSMEGLLQRLEQELIGN